MLTERGINSFDGDEPSLVSAQNKFGVNVSWKSMFCELFDTENDDVRELFRTCLVGTTDMAKFKHSSITIRSDQWQESEAAWYRIEHRLRSVLIKSLKCDTICLLLRSLEAIVLLFLDQGVAPPVNLTPQPLSDLLEMPIFVSSASLIIALKDSSFHRLLLHAVCQFYGLRSKVCF